MCRASQAGRTGPWVAVGGVKAGVRQPFSALEDRRASTPGRFHSAFGAFRPELAAL